jgi:isochorismate synthase
VRTEGRAFRAAAVAGTIGRGADAAEDERLGRALLASEKDREEHAIVVAFIRDLLRPLAETLEVAPEPGLMRLRYVHHLVTEIAGTVPDGNGLLALGERLHPTPAVGGEPRDVALAMVDEHEGFDRGWYAGPIGWLGADGDGELCVALRCGIVDDTRASLFAGCGIVADSDPNAEWEESRIKLRAVVSALGIPGDEP